MFSIDREGMVGLLILKQPQLISESAGDPAQRDQPYLIRVIGRSLKDLRVSS